MRDAIRGIAIGVLALATIGALASRFGITHVNVPRPSGSGAWHAARATGLVGFAALSLDVILGLALSTRASDRVLPRAHAVDLHGWLSPLSLALVAGHALVLLVDGYLKLDVLDVLVPFASTAYRPVAVGIGVLAAYVVLVVHASFALRKRLGTRTWRRLHYLSFVGFGASAVHGILAGTDAARPWAIAMYAAPLTAVLALVVYRIVRSPGGSVPGARRTTLPRTPPGPAPPSPDPVPVSYFGY